jgi:AraC-like DNA-binding protein
MPFTRIVEDRALGEGVFGQVSQGLERLCALHAKNSIVAAPAYPGIERIQAQFLGDVFDPHRHDTYAIGVTMGGVQRFHYRGECHHSLPGCVIVLHPDEEHDGGAATDASLVYRMLYIEPSLLAKGLDAWGGGLPFVADPVVHDDGLAQLLCTAAGELDRELDDLFVDDFISQVAARLSLHARMPQKLLGVVARDRVTMARDYLEANVLRGVRSDELERVTGLDRFALSRHFRAAFATSPHRFLLMRRLQRARLMIADGEPLAETAIATGFADQSHLTRHFKKAFGIAPGAWVAMVGAGRNRTGSPH